MKYWGYYVYADTVVANEIGTPGEPTDNFVRRILSEHSHTYKSWEHGDTFVIYPGDDRYGIRKDGKLVPGTELFALVMADLIAGKALAVTL